MIIEDDKVIVTGSEVLFGDETSRKWLRSILMNNVVEVTFTKKDGTERVMNCTLNPDVLPAVQKEETEVAKPRKKSEDSLGVYDVDVKDWRSFRWDTVKRVVLNLGD